MTFNPNWISLLGLTFDIAGAIVLAKGIFISKKMVEKISVPRWGGKEEDNLKLPLAQDRIAQMKYAKAGIILMGIGFTIQALGNLFIPN